MIVPARRFPPGQAPRTGRGGGSFPGGRGHAGRIRVGAKGCVAP
jgi:hypothetical protein